MMRLQRVMAIGAAACGMAMFCGGARAAATYTFSSGAATVDASAHTAVVPIYLHEVSGGTSQINADGGLYSFGLSLTVTGGPGTIQSVVRNAAFDEVNKSTTADTAATLWADQNVNFPNGPTVDQNGNVLLATLTLKGVTGDTSLSVGDYGAGTQTADYNSVALDPSAVYTTTVTVATPEPASIGVVGLGVVMLVRRRRGR